MSARLSRFAIVGGVNTAVHCSTYLAMALVLPYLLAHLAAMGVATACSYLLNCRFTFQVAPGWRSFLRFPLSTIANVALSTAGVWGAVEWAGIDARLATVLAGVVATPVTFLVSRACLTGTLGRDGAERRGQGDRERWRTTAAGGLVVVGVALLSQVPALVNPSFYFWDDSAAQFLPMWHRLGERLLAGEWPLLLDLDAWMGGNLAAEALFGVWNPVNLLDYVLVVWIGDLAVAATVVKTQFLVTLGLGVFLLCREYGATRAAASVMGVALPVSGFVLYFQAATWAGGLMAFAWVPWAWWSLRRYSRGRAVALVPFALGFLCVSAGEPYGLLALCFVYVGMLVESLARGDGAAGVRRLTLLGLAVGSTIALPFLPVVMAGPVSWRSGLELFNVGKLVPSLADLLNLSLPSFIPQILSFGSVRMTVPAIYFAWFVVPLLPWLDWRSVAVKWRQYAAALVVAVGYVGLCVGPSNVWLFRWPLRHIAVLYLALSVLIAVALSHGLRTDRARRRLMLTAGALAVSGYLAFAAWPSASWKHLASLGLLAVLSMIVVRSPGTVLATVLHVGTACVLMAQVWWFPANRDVAFYNFPTNVQRLRDDFAELRGKTVVQLADWESLPDQDIASREVWRHLLFGNMHAVAGVPSLVSYTGMGFRALHERLCLNYYGSVCQRGHKALWTEDEVGVPLVDQVKAERVVVRNGPPRRPAGWRTVERNGDITVLARNRALPWPRGRLSAAKGVDVTSDVCRGDRRETVRVVTRSGPGELVFARLAWPGYSAVINGRRIPVGATSAGLLKVSIPEGATSGKVEIEWTPPGYAAALASATAGLLVAGSLSATPRRRRRREGAAPC